MVIGDDFAIDISGNITHIAGTTNYTVIVFHRWLQDLADDPSSASGGDLIDITSPTPSERFTDDIIQLLGSYNIDDNAAEFLYAGSIKQGTGATETIYSGLRVLGSVNTAATQIQIVQDKVLYNGDSPFWGTQASGGYNGDAAQNLLMRVLIKSRVNGCDIDQQKIIVQLRHYFDSYAFFNVTLGEGEAVAAVSSVDDPQNNTTQATVTAYTHVTNVEGFQQIDIGDGNGNQPYYSKWTYGADTSGDQLKGVWEFIKDLTYTGTAKTIHGIDGEMFQGVSHTYIYDGLAGDFTEDEEVVWGTRLAYDALSTTAGFTAGNYVRIGALGAAGRIMYDNASNEITVALEDTSITIIDDDTITEYDKSTGVTGVTAVVNVTITDNDKQGGSGILLADNESGVKHHIQLRTGAAPVNNIRVRGLSSTATADVNVTITARTITPVFLGSYVGTLIGGFGVGIDSGDLTSSDTVIDLDGDTNTPPNNVTFSLNAVVVGEDYIVVGPKAAGNDFAFDQMSLSTTLSGAAEIAVVVGTIPVNTPQTGNLRITLDDGRIRLQAYTSHNGTTTFTIASSDYTDPDDATSGNDVMVAYIDKLCDADPQTYTTIYTSGPQNLWVRVRDGGTTPIKTYEAASSLGPTGGSATASRITDA